MKKTRKMLKKSTLAVLFLWALNPINAADKMDPQLELGCKIYMCLNGGQALPECQIPLQTYYTLTSNQYTQAYGESLPKMCVAQFL